MAEQELISPHKHIKYTSTSGTILTENQLETSKSTQPKLQERSPRNWVGQEEKGALCMTRPMSLGETCKREGPHCQTLVWGVPLPAEISVGTERGAGEAQTLFECRHADLLTVRVKRNQLLMAAPPLFFPSLTLLPNQKHAPSRATNTNMLSANRTWERTPVTSVETVLRVWAVVLAESCSPLSMYTWKGWLLYHLSHQGSS